MSGFGRTGEWFAVNHWNVVPDLITMAKGLTSSYVPLGAVGMRRAIGDAFGTTVFPSGLTYSSHPLACATALAVIDVMEQDEPGRTRPRAWPRACGAAAGRWPPSIRRSEPSGRSGCSASSNWCGIARRCEPLAPFNGTSPEMAALAEVLPTGRIVHGRALERVLHQPAADDQRSGIARGLCDHRPGLAADRCGRDGVICTYP